MPETRAAHGPDLQRRIVDLAAAIDPSRPFATALLLWTAWHGIVSLRIHKREWDWGYSPDEANELMVKAFRAANAAAPAS